MNLSKYTKEELEVIETFLLQAHDENISGVLKLIKEINTNNVKKMADIILNEAIDNGYGILKDDMSVIVAKVVKI